MRPRAWTAMGVALGALMAAHVARNPFGAWVLFSACDVAAVATALGLCLRVRTVVAAALLFQLAVGLPAFVVGLFTTYVPTLTGVAVHLGPMACGLAVTGRGGWPRRTALVDGAMYVVVLLATRALTPPAMNLNLVHAIWPPVAGLFATKATYHAAHVGSVLAALLLVDRIARLSFSRASSRMPPRGSA